MDRCSVVIVGGGASGLFAAHKLVEAGVEGVVLLEAQAELGGRIKTIRVNEEWLELGAQWIHGRGENPLWKFCQKAEVCQFCLKRGTLSLSQRSERASYFRDTRLMIKSTLWGTWCL